MTNRRDLLFGAAGLAAAGTAYGLRPRKKLSLLGSRKIEDVVPAAFGPWTSQLNANLIQPTREGSLAARLYSQTMTRLYYHQDTGEEVMIFVRAGDGDMYETVTGLQGVIPAPESPELPAQWPASGED